MSRREALDGLLSGCRLRWLRLRRLRLRLLLLLLLFFLGHVMPDRATGRSTYHGMMSRDVPRHGAYGGTFEATLRDGRFGSSQERRPHY